MTIISAKLALAVNNIRHQMIRKKGTKMRLRILQEKTALKNKTANR